MPPTDVGSSEPELSLTGGASADIAADYGNARDELVAAVHLARPEQLAHLCARVLDRWGVVKAWDEVLAPTLAAVGVLSFDGSPGIGDEMIVSEAIGAELRDLTRRRRPRLGTNDSIVMVGANGDLDSLPLLALEAALADVGLDSCNLGARLLPSALRHAPTRKRPQIVSLWSTSPRPDDDLTWTAFSRPIRQRRSGRPGGRRTSRWWVARSCARRAWQPQYVASSSRD